MFQQHFFNYNFHIILNNNFWNLLPNKPLINMLDLQNNFKIISILKWKKQIQKIMEKKEEREFRNPHVQHVATIYKNKKNFLITKQIRASTSMDAKFCKMQKILHFTHFDQKNTNISEYKNVYKCSIATVTVYMHGYCSTCIYYFILFFSLSLSLVSGFSPFFSFFSLFCLCFFFLLSSSSGSNPCRPRH